MSTEIDIYNMALTALGVNDRVVTPDDPGRAQVLKFEWPEVMERFLETHPWSFAKSAATLIEEPDVDPVGTWTGVYTLPPDLVTTRYIDPEESRIPFETVWTSGELYLMTEKTDPVLLWYTALVTTYSRWSAQARSAAAYRLAIAVRPNLADSDLRSIKILKEESAVAWTAATTHDMLSTQRERVSSMTALSTSRRP